MKKLLSISACAAASVAMLAAVYTAEGQSQREPAKQAPEAAVKLADANNRFGFAIFSDLHSAGENLFLSPASIAMAMQMVGEGAKADTLTEMTRTMHLDGIETAAANRALMNELNSREGVTLNVANSFWAEESRISLNPDYMGKVRNDYSGDVRNVSFRDPETRKVINRWVSERTNELIPELIAVLPPDTIACLVNAIYFKGEWTAKFDPDKTRDAKFHRQDGTEADVRMMSREARMEYGEHDGVQVVRLPYGEDRNAAMWVMLPPADSSVAALVRSLDTEHLKQLMQVRSRQGTFELPRFTMRYKTELNDTLKKLGIRQAFSASDARFDGIGESPEGPFFISAVIHEAVVIVDEEGTEAAAATAIISRTGARPPEPFKMVCDRPFLFVITDEPTGQILFMGAMYDPKDPDAE